MPPSPSPLYTHVTGINDDLTCFISICIFKKIFETRGIRLVILKSENASVSLELDRNELFASETLFTSVLFTTKVSVTRQQKQRFTK